MKKYYCFIAFFNFILGYILFYVLIPWVINFIYIAKSFGWIIDPTLDDGLLLPFLILGTFTSGLYFFILISINIILWKKVSMKKSQYVFFILVLFILGFLSFSCYKGRKYI